MSEIGTGEAILCVLLASLLSVKYLSWSGAVLLIITLASFCLVKLQQLQNFWRCRGIRGPQGNLLFGNALQLREGFRTFDIENCKLYGSIFGTIVLGKPDLVVSDRKMLKDILVKHFAYFSNRRAQYCVRSKVNVINHMLSVMRDNQWKSVRSAVAPAFATSQLKKLTQTMQECISETETELELIIREKDGVFDAGRLIADLMLDIVGRVMFGIRMRSGDNEPNEFAYYCRKVLNFTFTDYKLICDAMFPNLMALVEECMRRTIFDNDCNEFFKNFAANLRNNSKETDLTAFLKVLLYRMEPDLEMQMDNTTRKPGKYLNPMEVAGQCFLFLIAGYETTAWTITFAMYILANFLEIQNKTYESINDFADKEGNFEYQEVSSMTYLEQIMMETLRLYPPAPRFDRECSADVQIGDVCLTKGCIVSVPIFALHYDENVYPEPYKFNPERFTKEERSKRDPLSYLPFGYGPRNCLGKRFAQLEFQLVLARLLLKYRFNILDKTPGYPLTLNTAGMTRPASPIILKVSKRH